MSGSQEPLLDDLTVAVIGGTGRIGRAVVEAMLAQGARVFVPTRRPENLTRLRNSLPADLQPELAGFLGDIGTPSGAADVALQIGNAIDDLTAVVCAVPPSPAQRPEPDGGHRSRPESIVRLHAAVIDAFLPLVDLSGSYTALNCSSDGEANSDLAHLIQRHWRATRGRPRINHVVIPRELGNDEHTRQQLRMLGDYLAWLASPVSGSRGHTIRLHGPPAQ
ncbi:SDR family NAD(P)-dependent oxidoreductase [Micromonospora sp. SL4-19]|uniref:SDR family NAD(P)-dependent oxidoreductase n=1 Tax=Micromonospora sp. SL4-19 TaxID=3399129 RepID=UPI003A4E166C